MPRKHPKKKNRSAATVAAAAASYHSSRQIDDFAQQLMDAVAHADDTAVGVLQPSSSFSEEREEGALDGMIPPCVASDNNNNNNNNNNSNNNKRMRSGSTHAEESPEKKGRGRTPSDERGKAGTRTRLSSTSDMGHRTSEALLRGKVSRGVVGPAVIELRHEGATRTEAEALQQHDSLSRLNTLYLPGNENAGERGASPGSHSAVDDTVDECRRLWRRRSELSQIPPGALALYTRLAECGVNAVDRPFATCVVGRAIQVMEEWATSFS